MLTDEQRNKRWTNAPLAFSTPVACLRAQFNYTEALAVTTLDSGRVSGGVSEWSSERGL